MNCVQQRSQPADLAYAPPTYQSPDVEAPATVATVRLCRPLGFLGRQDDALAWWNIYGVEREPEEETLARIVFDTLRAAAARGATPAPAWDEILALVPHDRPAEVDRLATVAALLT